MSERENDLQRRRVGRLQGDNRAALAASGVDVNSGAAIKVAERYAVAGRRRCVCHIRGERHEKRKHLWAASGEQSG